MAYAKKEAIAEGRAEGLAEGRAEGRAEIARNLKAAGIDYAIISSATGLALEDVEQL
jgi:predicted transposase/invertase (TIGR01784 family)